jgi:hypothetical protein
MTVARRLTRRSVIFRHGTLRIPKSGQFFGLSSLGTGHCPVHTRQSGAPWAGANLFCSILIELPQGSFSLCVYVNFMHLIKDQLDKLVSPKGLGWSLNTKSIIGNG